MGLFDGTALERPLRCEHCLELEADCRCPPPAAPSAPSRPQAVRVQVEKRKKGKHVTVVRGCTLEPPQQVELLTYLKTHCGAGGTLKEEHLEIQGEHLDRVRELLVGRGFRVR